MSVKKLHKTVKRPARTDLPEAWFLMSREEISVRTLRALFPEDDSVDMWPLAGVMEIMIGERESIDIEMIEPRFDSEEDQKFIEEKGIRTLFTVVFDPGLYDKAKPILQKLAEGTDSLICGDTPDFTPVITGKESFF